MTEVLKGDIQEGDLIVTGENRGGGDGGGTTNPFTPSMFKK